MIYLSDVVYHIPVNIILVTILSDSHLGAAESLEVINYVSNAFICSQQQILVFQLHTILK